MEKIDFGPLYKGTGKLRYGNKSLILDTDQGIVDYYKAMIPKYYTDITRQRHPAHISVIRNEVIPTMGLWRKYEDEIVDFEYSGFIRNGEIYWWLDAFSVRLEEIRAELGLYVVDQFTTPPSGYLKTFHITLGNWKHVKNEYGN